MDRKPLICNECDMRYESDLFTEDPSETFVCPMCGTLVLVPAPNVVVVPAQQTRLPAAA